ncbi:UDP-N-acetylglucosamine transferase subunit ALG14 [Aliiroseovarius sp. S1339]|uniref:UDP-N-acetylglucosamine transferase subunit ALG14 n=1 Tax=Aliiroseovarius sp. S1339 TaxID=2936990 RepID=UPI0020C05BFA|nr:UDP-N-acetylglucosamine transferase subunit ALG14 [Aliiroseovarius sp. S1339]MCK8465173.1 UDP-N-acetylglucosamine transferase subunit ALG14 [Aliiroseovarius sp. S1339]
MNVGKSVRVMAVASAGGHWVQLRRLRNAWQGLDVTYVSTDAELKPIIAQEARSEGAPEPTFFAIVEANRWQKTKLLKQLFQLLFVFIRTRPDVVVTTGAAPGYFALRLGKLFGARTVWIDSVANAGELSLSGQKVGKHVDLWLTQWEHLATPDGPQYLGSVL